MGKRMSERDKRRTWGIVTILAVLGLVGWGVYESMDESDVTGAADTSDPQNREDAIQERIDEAQDSNLRQTQETQDTSDLY